MERIFSEQTLAACFIESDQTRDHFARRHGLCECDRLLAGDKLTKVIGLLGMIQMPGINFLAMAAWHSVHQRGQLSIYLRPMGGKVPGIYGPSGDTQ